MKLHPRTLVVALLLVLLAAIAPTSHAQPPDRASDAREKVAPPARTKIMERMAETGRSPVLVQVDVAALRELGRDAPSQARRGELRERISDRQARVLARLPARVLARLKRYRNLPFLALDLGPGDLATLEQLPEVVSIEPDRLHAPDLGASVPHTGGDGAWAVGATGAGQAVAILDTGVDAAHPFFQTTSGTRVVEEACFSTNSSGLGSTSLCTGGQEVSIGSGAAAPCSRGGCDHGTHVAGIAAGDDAVYAGVAPEASIIAIQVFSLVNKAGTCSNCILAWTSDLVAALDHVLDLSESYSIAAVNMSLGGDVATSISSCPTGTAAAIGLLRDAGIATVVSAGNDGRPDGLASPGCVPAAVTVGATSNGDAVLSFSNGASWMDFFAPGGSIRSAVPGTGTAVKSGTSMAAPHVAGAIAALRSLRPDATLDELLATLATTAEPVADPDNGYVIPRIQVDTAANLLLDEANLPVIVVADDDLDNGSVEAGNFATLGVLSAPDAYGGQALRGAGAGDDIFRFSPDLPRPGIYRVHAWWPSIADAPQAAAYDVFGAGGAISSLDIDQRTGGGEWNLLGDFNLSDDGSSYVELVSGSTPESLADAVRFEYLSLRIEPFDLPLAFVGATYNETLPVTGGLPPYLVTPLSLDLPPGLSFDASTLTVSGTATTDSDGVLSLEIRDADGDLVSGNFPISARTPRQISGEVTLDGAPLEGVAFSALPGGSCTDSDAAGGYTCTVPDGWSGVVAPVLERHVFTPPSRSYSTLSADESRQDYLTAFSPETVWVEDALPAGAQAVASSDGWNWVGTPAFSGALAHRSPAAAGAHQHYFTGASLPVTTGDVLFTYIYLDPANPPRQVMLQWFDGSWEHRAYWGENLVTWGTSANGTAGRRHMGPLPPAGQWVRLEIPAALVALENRIVSGMAFSLYDGAATWDRTGLLPATAEPTVAFSSSTYETSEAAGEVQIMVTRSGNLSSGSSVTYTTAPGTATPGSDYVATSGTLDFASGQAQRSFTVTLLDDVETEADETVLLSLSGAGGAVLGVPSIATLTLIEDDIAPPASSHAIAGLVTRAGSPLAGVAFSSEPGGDCTDTDAAGSYSCTVPDGWTGTLTPAFQNYTFTPASRSYSTLIADESGQNYLAEFTAEVVWVEDALPAGAQAVASTDGWSWISAPVFSGALAHRSPAAAGPHQHYFTGASLPVTTGDVLFTYVYLDPANPPRQVMLQWFDGSWEHRAYWGENLITWGTSANGSAGRHRMGPLPPTGQWVRLEIPAALVALENRIVSGMAFSLYDGAATWDRTGLLPAAAAPTIAFSSSAYEAGEAAGEVQIAVTRSGHLSSASSVTYATAPGTATPGSDFVAAGGTLDFAAGQAQRSITVTLLDDVNVEGDETVLLSLSAPSGALLGTPASATLKIAEDDEAPPPTDRVISGTVTVDGAPLADVALTALPDGVCTDTDAVGSYSCTVPDGWTGTLTPSFQDYTFIPASRSYSTLVADEPGQNYLAEFGSDVFWLEDALPAGAQAVASSDGWNWVASPVFSGALAHQSPPAAGPHQHYFTGASLPVTTGDVLFTYVYLDPANPPRQVMLQWFDGSWEHRAYWGENLITWGTSANGSAGRRRMGPLPPAGQWVRLEIPASLVALENRTVIGMAFTLYDGAATWDRAGRTPASEGSSFAFLTANYEADESQGTKYIAVTRSGDLSQPASVDYAITPGTATPGSDYVATASGTLHFASGRAQRSFLLTMIDDTHVEADETVLLSLSAPDGAVLGTPASATLTLVDDDIAPPAPDRVVAGTVSVDGTPLAGVALAAPPDAVCTDSDVTGAYSCSVPDGWTGTVTPSFQDYTFTPASRSYADLSADASGQSYVATPPPPPDRVISGSVTVDGAPLADVALAALPDGVCTDTDAAGSYSCTVPDGWTGTLTPSFQDYTFTPASRSYSTLVADEPGQNYLAESTSDVLWLEDALPAGAQAVASSDGWNWVASPVFSGALAHQSPPAAGPHQHYFTGASLPVTTGDVLFTYVYLDPANPPRQVMLQWFDGSWEHRAYWGENLITWGTSANGSAGRRHMGPLPPAGQWVRLEIPASLVALENRTVIGMAFTLYDGAATWDRAGRTPASEGSSFAFLTANYEADESQGTKYIAVTRSGDLSQPASVGYAITPGTATPGSDYVATSGTLNFASGQAQRSFTVTLVDDAVVEGDETVLLSLSAPSGALLGTPATATLNVADDDDVARAIDRIISGTVRRDGAAFQGVALTALPGGACTTTDSTGAYSCTVPDGWTGTVTPSAFGHAFNPASRSYSGVVASITGADFAAVAAPGVDVSRMVLTSLDGSASGERAGIRLNGFANLFRFGEGASIVGDLNGDGFDDVAAGNDSGRNQGFIVFGNTTAALGGMNGGGGLTVDGIDGANGFTVNGASFPTSGVEGIFRRAAGGDIDGDGVADLILGDRGLSGPQQAHAVLGGQNFDAMHGASLITGGFDLGVLAGGGGTSGATFDLFPRVATSGEPVAVASGDFDGDGFADVLMGQPYPSTGAGGLADAAGTSFLVWGDAGGALAGLGALPNGNAGAQVTFSVPVPTGTSSPVFLGRAVTNLGDINGDGIDDLAVSAVQGSTTFRAPRAYVVFGGRSNIESVAAGDLESLDGSNGGFRVTNSLFNGAPQIGTSISGAGDFNGDGLGDFLVGAPGPGGISVVGVLFGRSGGFGNVDLASLTGTPGGGSGFTSQGFVVIGPAGQRDGTSVAAAGDVNGDGLDDIVVGAPNALSGPGAAYVIFGTANPAGLLATFDNDTPADPGDDLLAVLPGEGGVEFDVGGALVGKGVALVNGPSEVFGALGSAVSGGGSVNGDGFDDVVVGAPAQNSATLSQVGQAYVVYGQDFNGALAAPAGSPLAADGNGQSLIGSSAGDVMNGGGFSSLVMRGGAGNDTLRFDFDNARTMRVAGGGDTASDAASIAAGAGDTLGLSVGGGLDLDFTAALPSGARTSALFDGIEAIDLSNAGNGIATGNNTVVLGLRDVLQMSDTSHVLRIDGDTGDSVVASGGWQAAGSLGGYSRYVVPGTAAVLLVDPRVTANSSFD